MVKRCYWFCPLVLCGENIPQTPVRNSFISNLSMNSGMYSRDMMVRIIHAGGREEVSQSGILVSNLMTKYPGMCLAKPEVFKFPHASLLSSGEVLLPGQKYFLIPQTTVQKLKKNYEAKMELSKGEELTDSSICSDKEIYVPTEKNSKISPRKSQRRKKQFVAPIQKQNSRRRIDWEPSLMSIEETSP